MRKDLTLFLIAAILVVEILFVFAGSAAAHKPSDSYLTLTVAGERVDGRWDIALRDLDHAIGLDKDQNGKLTWGEVRAKHSEIEAFALARLSLESGGAPCRLSPRRHLIEQHSDEAYTALYFSADCAGAVRTLSVRYGLFFDLDPTHRGLFQLRNGGSAVTAIFAPDRRTFSWRENSSGFIRGFLTYFAEGFRHILIGFDHILFLICLLLPAGLRRVDGQWQRVANWREALWPVIHTVTAFTLAHSVTLGATTLGLVFLPAWLVEPAIAASIIFAASNNIWPVVIRRLWLMAFGFGLIHGFGFAGVLADLDLPREALFVSLLSFNLGIEAGQLAIIAATLPLIGVAGRIKSYSRTMMPVGSACTASIAVVWLVERVSGGVLF